MLPSSELSAHGVDEAWSDLRHHLGWTRGEGTVVFIGVETRSRAEDIRNRANLWDSRVGERWSQAPRDTSAGPWLRRCLPVPGLLRVDLWEDDARIPALHALNEMRIRLAQPGSGCLVLRGPVSLLKEASREAADL